MNYSLGNSGKKDFATLSNVNSFSVKPDNSLAEEERSEDIKVPSGETLAKLPLPPGRVSISAPKPAPLATAALKPTSQVPGSVTTATEPATPVPGPPLPSTNNPVAPPPPPKFARPPPPNPPKGGTAPKPSHGKDLSSAKKGESDSQKAKLKPFFWDKVLANPEQSMVWNEIKAGSFQ